MKLENVKYAIIEGENNKNRLRWQPIFILRYNLISLILGR